jgi:response regulator RpfG family c-di-GMP phosphodiesterase
MKILLVEDEPELRKLIVFMIDSLIEATVMETSGGDEAIRVLAENSDFALIISDLQMAKGTGEDVYRYLLNEKKVIPFILCASANPEVSEIFKTHPPYGLLIKPNFFSGFEKLIRDFAEAHAAGVKEIEYCPIRTATVLSFGLLYCDLYFKLHDEKYIKVMREGDVFDVADFDRFGAKKVDFLYVRTQEAKRVLGKIYKNLSQFSQSPLEAASARDEIEISKASLEVIHEFSQVMGFAPEAQQLTHECVNFAVKTIERNPALAKLYSQLVVDPNSYLSSHSIVLANVACGIASLLGWTSHLIFYKLSLASFLHDISLTSNELAKVQLLKELDLEDPPFSVEDKKRFFQHPEQAARLVSEFGDLPSGVGAIIVEHHERPDGSGFPIGMDFTKISPLSAVFIVAHDLVSFRAKISSTADLSYFVKNLEDAFHKGAFKKITQVVTDSLPADA